MVNAKNVAFKVNKQTPISQGPAQAYGTVINCRKQVGKRAGLAQKEVRSHHVPLSNIPGALKRKRGDDGKSESAESSNGTWSPGNNTTSTSSSSSSLGRPLLTQHWQQCKPTRLRKGKTLSKGVDLDCWFTILSFSDPAQLLEMREKIASCYRFLRDNPMLWKHARNYYYGKDMPDPPSELTEFQYAHLRHGHGCMSCGAKNTRKTYWAFLRRWCKTCLQSKTLREHDALALLRDDNGEDISLIKSCLPSGIFDSWGNFVGVGPATTHSLKTVYSLPDVQKLVAEYRAEARARSADPAEMRAWYTTWHANKIKIIEERRAFAKKMELWEETTRSTKTFDYQARKAARKLYFEQKAKQLSPPIDLRQMEACPSYRRAVAIPKEPNITSWNQLRPKLEKEAAEIVTQERMQEAGSAVPSSSGGSTPLHGNLEQNYMPLFAGMRHGLPPPPHAYMF
ncbi:hypothetical protein IAQ61_000374 [Plenodomus lingam]|uniref:F-box domain-containing protein n=1 Tax=Leptosphaeria maculans (strain JN3 / isolate v23.1.3 / race Av1-4-5-6-7-8) TaxID=985895 RepID=E5R4S4_LEPMJ|nr:hypothetical protein LEMA_P049030.1 [Plenodomus lingam JN3]KAH9881647.1 hypothetical protein IAQ61_000374 [Plenodomus lingam]CBX92197.1 hypothetical protein LEMA_P049030.1 [Plenodomus lingam JN3]